MESLEVREKSLLYGRFYGLGDWLDTQSIGRFLTLEQVVGWFLAHMNFVVLEL